jgi:hypothetical protein
MTAQDEEPVLRAIRIKSDGCGRQSLSVGLTQKYALHHEESLNRRQTTKPGNSSSNSPLMWKNRVVTVVAAPPRRGVTMARRQCKRCG